MATHSFSMWDFLEYLEKMLCYKMHPKTKTPMGHISWKKKAVIYLHVSKIAPFETGTHFIAYQYGVNTWKLHPYQSKIYIYSFDFYRIFSFPQPILPTNRGLSLTPGNTVSLIFIILGTSLFMLFLQNIVHILS